MSLQTWRDVAVVVLAFEGFLMALVVGAAVYFAIRGVFWLKIRIRALSRPARSRLAQVETAMERVSEAAVAPFLWMGANWARVCAVWRGVAQKDGRNANE